MRGRTRDAAVGNALSRASSHGEAEVERLVLAVPAQLAEAQRRRRAANTSFSLISAAARTWLPRLGLATTALALTAMLWPIHRDAPDRGERALETDSLERWLVTGATPSSVSDPVLDALMR